MNFSMIFSAVDKASRTMGKIMASERRMAAASQRNSLRSDRATSRTMRTMAALGRTSRRVFRTIVSGARSAGRAVNALHRKTVKLGKFGVGQIGNGFGRVQGGLMAGVAAVTVAYGAALLAAGGLVGTASEFERFQTILMTTEGSASAAEEAMGWVQNFAVKTPYELDQVTDAFVSLRAYGLDPTQGLLQTLGDTSAAMGKPLGQAVEAIADAVTGENERLKEFGIKASKTGSEIAYEYTNAAGESVRVAVDAGNRMAIQQTLMGIMNEKYEGSMGRLSQTWDGMTSNIMDMWTKFQMMIMNAGLFDWMKDKLRGVLDTINQMEADGTLLEWATAISNAIQTALTNMWEFAKGIRGIILDVGGHLSIAAEYVGGWKNLAMILAGIVFAPTLISTAAGLVQIATGLAALTTALMANPIILAIAAIAGGVYLIYRNWDTIGPYFQRIWTGIKTTVSLVWDWLKAAFAWSPVGLIVSNWDGISAALSAPIETGKALAKSAWEGTKMLFSWTPLDLIISNWNGIGAALSAPVDTAKALVQAAWDSVKAIFAGDWMPKLDTSALSAAVDDMTAIVRRAWDTLSGIFDSIVGAAVVLGDKVGQAISVAVSGAEAALNALGGNKGVERIFGQLDALAERGFSADFVQGQALTEALSTGEISLDSYRQTLEAVSQEGGSFAQVAREMIESSLLLDAFTMPEPPALKLPPTQEIDGVMAKLAAIQTASGRTPEIMRGAMTSLESILAGTNFTDQGVALMRTLATGIRTGTQLVVAATVAATQQVRDHLPSSPAKTGPLSDIHRLKFGETIASSIRSEPMIRAMRAATAATMAVALPISQDMAVAATAVPSSAARSVLPNAQDARSASTPGPLARSGGGGSETAKTPISVTFGDTHINGGSPTAQRDLRETAAQERRKFVRLLEHHHANEERKAF